MTAPFRMKSSRRLAPRCGTEGTSSSSSGAPPSHGGGDLARISASMQKNTTKLGSIDSALSQHEGILALALRAGRVGLWSRNLLTDRADWSAQLHEIFGTDAETFDSSTAGLMSIIDPEDRAAVRQAVQDAIAHHGDLAIEFRIKLQNGELR